MNYEQLNNKILEMDLSIYYPSNFVRKLSQEEYAEKHDTLVKGGTGTLSQKDREQNLILMLKTNYLKRLESSIHSFRLTFERLAKKHEKLINKIENYKENREEYKEIDLDLNKEEYSEEEMDLLIEGKINFNLKEMRASEWLEKIKRDYKVIKELLREANKINRDKDAKLKTLVEIIEEKIENPINKDNKKILIFTAYADTANYLYLNLKEELSEKKLNLGLVTGAGQNSSTIGLKNFEEILQSFSPKSKGKINCKEEIDILVATDCISEGQNLQDCDYLINYDIHWNPVRITQRFGRIDRIGSKNQKIQLVNFWPEKDLEKYINLEKRVKNRMALSDMSGTGQENIFEIKEDEDNYLDFRGEQLKKLQNEVIDLEDMDDTISLTDFTLDDYKMDLTNYLDKNEKLKYLPEGIYSIVPLPKENDYSENQVPKNIKGFIKPGVIFCLKLKSSKKEQIEKSLEKFNPITPYFLVYIFDDGEIKFNYTNLKQLLEIYKLLASGENQPYEELEKIFTKETNDGENMDKYSELLGSIVKQINNKLNHQSMKTLAAGAGRGQISLISKENQISDEEEFDLISFLIIKDKENYNG
jgi:superfamily II DNA/RNA helicase